MSFPSKTAVLIVAGGSGSRMGGERPKPYLSLVDMPVLCRTIRAFSTHLGIGAIQVVIRQEDIELYEEISVGLSLLPPVVGGALRQDSVLNGLEALQSHGFERVLIHDAARPLVSHALITRLLEGLKTADAVIPALPLTETLKRVDGSLSQGTVDRAGLYAAQTPQGFAFEAILAAHRQCKGQMLTDDAAVAEKAGMAVQVIAGERQNIKLTTMEDMQAAMMLIEQGYETRVGMGYDVHRVEKYEPSMAVGKRSITICGIKIPHDYKAIGHSDADVGLHAVVDAMLGACGGGDIGMHFSPDDPEWRGADSSRFLVHAFRLLKSKGGQLVHIDITIICEKPHISPHREAMSGHIASLLALSEDRVSVKATTTEKMGFTGRGEGIAAHAIATVKLPRVPHA